MSNVLKNRLLTASLALLFCGVFATPGFAQSTPTQGTMPNAGIPGKRHGARHASLMFALLKNYLELTPTQETQIKTIFQQSHEQAKQERQFANGDKKMLHQLKRDRFEKTIGQIRAVLTPEQTQKLDKVRDEIKSRRTARAA